MENSRSMDDRRIRHHVRSRSFLLLTDERGLRVETWITFWKREFRRELGASAPRFQSDGFHHRLRGEESYAEKWEYVRANPVRAGLVKKPEDWPYQGVIHELRC
jgi:REP element-mobilizing transposase RayT